MYQNYNYYPQTQQPAVNTVPSYSQTGYYRPVQPQVALKGRLVSSLEEARATSIDFDGSIFYFPDLANKCIYTKQINMDGTATLNVYEMKAVPIMNEQQIVASMNNYITRDEFEQAIAQLHQTFKPVEQLVVKEPVVPKKTELKNF